MYIIVVGAGEVGSYVARVLVGEGHEVAIVDIDGELTRSLDNAMNALVVQGSGVNPAVLHSAGIEQADLLLAVTATDEVNLIVCMTGRKHGADKLRSVARVRWAWHASGDPALSAADLGLDALISPRQEIASEAVGVLRYAGSGEVWELVGGKVLLVGMSLSEDSPLVHDTIAGVRRDFEKEFLVVAAQNKDGARIPDGSDRLAEDDRAYVLSLAENVTELAILSGHPWSSVRRVMIVGCGNTGLAVAGELEKIQLPATIIERDLGRAEYVAGVLPKSLVLHGDGSDPVFLEQQIAESGSDAVVVLLKDSEVSLLIGIFAKSLGARKVVVRCDEPGYESLAHKLGVDAVLSPNRAVISALLRYVRRGNVESTLLLGNNDVEVIQFKIPEHPENRALLDKPLKDLEFPGGALVGIVVRGGTAFLASGDTVLMNGDEIFVSCGRDSLKTVEKLLA